MRYVISSEPIHLTAKLSPQTRFLSFVRPRYVPIKSNVTPNYSAMLHVGFQRATLPNFPAAIHDIVSTMNGQYEWSTQFAHTCNDRNHDRDTSWLNRSRIFLVRYWAREPTQKVKHSADTSLFTFVVKVSLHNLFTPHAFFLRIYIYWKKWRRSLLLVLRPSWKVSKGYLSGGIARRKVH